MVYFASNRIRLGILILIMTLACKDNYNPYKEMSELPNIIFLLTDDLRYDALGFMGNANVHTPHLDQLASEGVMFTNAYHVSPICLPSRASIMLGQYLGTHGAGFDRPSNMLVTVEEFDRSYPVLLRENGYYTGFIGKFGFPVKGSDKIVSDNLEDEVENLPVDVFDVWNGFPGQGSYMPKNGGFNGYDNKWKAKHLNEFMGYQALDFISNSKIQGKPFCLSLSFKAPHAPFLAEKDMLSFYENRNIPRMSNDDPIAFGKLPKSVRTKSRNALRYFGYVDGESWHLYKDENYQSFIKNYYALITGVDRVVGRIRNELEEQGLAHNTVIIFTSDNGFFAGSRQLTGKALLYDESAKAPMIVYDPRNKGKGRLEEGLISHVDIAPTILEYAGINKPNEMQGSSFVDIVNNIKENIHQAVYGENNFDNNLPIRSEVPDSNYSSIRSKFVRTKNFKLIRYHECQPVVEELWDMRKDPNETQNLIRNPAYSKVVQEMREDLDNFENKYVHYYN